MTGYMCTGSVYRFKGVVFEYGYPQGPWPLDEKGDPVEEDPSDEFWSLATEFAQMSEEEMKEYEIVTGGCMRLETGGIDD